MNELKQAYLPNTHTTYTTTTTTNRHTSTTNNTTTATAWLPPLQGFFQQMTDPPYHLWGFNLFDGNVGLPDAMHMKGPNNNKLSFEPLGIFNIMMFVI